MRKVILLGLSLFVWTGCAAPSKGTSEPTVTAPAAPSSQYTALDDIDYQIKITKEAMEQYKNQAFLLDDKAQRLIDINFSDYHNTEMLSQQAKEIANDLAQRLQQLEERRAQIVKEQEVKNSTSAPAKP
jgi:hypothetical protein